MPPRSGGRFLSPEKETSAPKPKAKPMPKASAAAESAASTKRKPSSEIADKGKRATPAKASAEIPATSRKSSPARASTDIPVSSAMPRKPSASASSRATYAEITAGRSGASSSHPSRRNQSVATTRQTPKMWLTPKTDKETTRPQTDTEARRVNTTNAFNFTNAGTAHTAKKFLWAIRLALEGELDNDTDEKISALQQTRWFDKGSRFLSYLFRHSNILHEDGSLSLDEFLTLDGAQRFMRDTWKGGAMSFPFPTKEHIHNRYPDMQGFVDGIKFLCPLALVIVHNPKGRFSTAFDLNNENWLGRLSTNPFRTYNIGEDPITNWTQLPDASDLARVMIRAVSGHSSGITDTAHASRKPIDVTRGPEYQGFLYHGTKRRFLASIMSEGLIPGGKSGGRQEVHLFKGDLAMKDPNLMRDDSDILILIDPTCLNGLNGYVTQNGYHLIPGTVPVEAIVGTWSFSMLGWLDFPSPAYQWATAEPRARFGTELMHMSHLQQVRWQSLKQDFQASRQAILDATARLSEDKSQQRVFNDRFQTYIGRDQDDHDTLFRAVNTVTKNVRSQELPDLAQPKTSVNILNSLKSRAIKALKTACAVNDIIAEEEDEFEELYQASKRRISSSSERSQASTNTEKPRRGRSVPREERQSSSDAEITARDKASESRGRSRSSSKSQSQTRDAGITARRSAKLLPRVHEVSAVKSYGSCYHCSQDAIFKCRVCDKEACVQCAFAGLSCECNILNYDCSDPSALNSTTKANEARLQKSATESQQSQNRHFGSSNEEVAKYRDQLFKQMLQDNEDGVSSGNPHLDRAIRNFQRNVKATERTFDCDRMPSVEEFYSQQNPLDPSVVNRPSRLFELTKESDDAEITAAIDLGRNMLASNMASNPRTRENAWLNNFETDTVNLLTLNMGDIVNRKVTLGGSSQLPESKQTDEFRVLPYLPFTNTAHITLVCEANGIEAYNHLAESQAYIGLVCDSEQGAPALACFMRGSRLLGSTVELIHHHDQFSHDDPNAKKGYWLMHGCIFRCIFGFKSEGEELDRLTGRRKRTDITAGKTPAEIEAIKENTKEYADITAHLTHDAIMSTQYLNDEDSIGVVADTVRSTCDKDVPRYQTVGDMLVRRAGLHEMRVAVFHINAHAWRAQSGRGISSWIAFLSKALALQVDYISGDGNLFAQRNFKNDTSSDYSSCILVDVLERMLAEHNKRHSFEEAITYSVVASTQHQEWIRSLAGVTADCDCILGIALSYGKQLTIQAERHKNAINPEAVEASYSEITLTEKERPKFFLPIDFCMRDSDAGWHSPLLSIYKVTAHKNYRTRQPRREAPESRNHEKGKQKGSQKGKRKDTRRVTQYSESESPERISLHNDNSSEESSSFKRWRQRNTLRSQAEYRQERADRSYQRQQYGRTYGSPYLRGAASSSNAPPYPPAPSRLTQEIRSVPTRPAQRSQGYWYWDNYHGWCWYWY